MTCYVLEQMVNVHVHEQWVHMNERKRTKDDDDASLWPRRQQIELAIMCLTVWLSVCLTDCLAQM